jgi:hypothetical protein
MSEDVDSRTLMHLNRLRADAAHRERYPFDCVLRLEHSTMPYFWGRFSTQERATEEGRKAMRATRREDLPYGKRCIGYFVTDNRTGNTEYEELAA